MSFLSRIFGSRNERLLKPYHETVKEINSFEEAVSKMSNEEILSKREFFRAKLNSEKDESKYLKSITVEAFALVKEMSSRVLGMKHFDVQCIGGLVLNEGLIAEMKTGEGKTLVATLAVYLNSLSGNKVHVITVNDYLANRDSGFLRPLYEALGVSVGCVYSGLSMEGRKEAYLSDVTYVTNNEIVFDYLRDNMKTDVDEMVLIHSDLHYAIIDEIDSILIDEARTPLIISGASNTSIDLYVIAHKVSSGLDDADFEVDKKSRAISISDSGYEKIDETLVRVGLLKRGETIFGDTMSDDDSEVLTPEKYVRNSHIFHHIQQALKAIHLFKADVDYLVRQGRVLIVDEFTGRIAEGRRYSDGLHQALEAKHNVKIHPESQTLASITYQNYFRMYNKLAGMTGTARTEVNEFNEIYDLDVVSIPTNVLVARADEIDSIYKTKNEKNKAIFKLVQSLQKKGQPALIGTTSVNRSEELSILFKKNDIKHNVLNAKHHEQEAQIIENAGGFGVVTIATNMAGRGTDIVLGGNLSKRIMNAVKGVDDEEKIQSITDSVTLEYEEEAKKVKEAGGLYVIGSERHESRRIDDQLRGRSGRQGDPGSSKFFLSLEDDLLKIFGGEKMDFILSKAGLKEDEVVEHALLSRVIVQAQKKVENYNFEMRKNLIKYDDIISEQRNAVYLRRQKIVQNDNNYIIQEIKLMLSDELKFLLSDLDISNEEFDRDFGDKLIVLSHFFKCKGLLDFDRSEFLRMDRIEAKILTMINDSYDEILINNNDEITNHKGILLYVLDACWKEHLYEIDRIRSGSTLKTYAQRDPVNEYKIEIFVAFEKMLVNYRNMVLGLLFK